jgi:UDP-glucose 4-epimerase
VIGPFNIGHGRETSVLDLLAALSQVTDRDIPEPTFEPERPGEVRRSCLDVSRARRELGWEAEVSLAQGLSVILAGL